MSKLHFLLSHDLFVAQASYLVPVYNPILLKYQSKISPKLDNRTYLGYYLTLRINTLYNLIRLTGR